MVVKSYVGLSGFLKKYLRFRSKLLSTLVVACSTTSVSETQLPKVRCHVCRFWVLGFSMVLCALPSV